MSDRWRVTPVGVAFTTLVLLAGVTCGFTETGQRADAQPGPADRSQPAVERRFEAKTLSAAIDDATGYLVTACGDDGEFVYRINLDPEVELSERYNVLRHAGTVYALAQANGRKPKPAVVGAMKRSAGFLKRSVIGPVPEQEDMLAAWSRDEINHSGGPDVAKLGATGLSLVALLSVERLAPGTTELEDLRALGRFVRYMQKDDGGFYSKFYPPPEGRDDSWTSLYYPGETALGMVMLYEHDPTDEWLESAVKALSYLAVQRKRGRDIPADHWALIATKRVLALANHGDVELDRDLLVTHGKKIVENIVRSQPTPTAQHLLGSHASDGRTTPTATRLEGLIAALDFLPAENGALRRRTMRSLEAGIAFLLLAQVDDDKHRGAMPRAIHRRADEGSSFNRRATEVRIDYVQHALSAYIGYERLAFKPPAAPAKPPVPSAGP